RWWRADRSTPPAASRVRRRSRLIVPEPEGEVAFDDLPWCFLFDGWQGDCEHCARHGNLRQILFVGAKMRRRDIVVGLGALVSHEASAATFPWLSPDLPDGTRAEAHLVQVPGKQPLIQLSDRPWNLEAPIQAFRTAIT